MNATNYKVALRHLTIVAPLFSLMVGNGCCDETKPETKPESNGIFATANYLTNEPGGSVVQIVIHFAPPNTNISISPFTRFAQRTNGMVVVTDPLRDGRYYRATNSFCGYIQLMSDAGEKISTLKREVNFADAYPATYDLKLVSHLLIQAVGKGPPLPLVLSGSNAGMVFHFTKYYKLSKPGVYYLTVWPKIYKRISQTSDTCQRIDISPITITINWEGK